MAGKHDIELDPTWGQVVSVWWLIIWRTIVGVVVLAFILGAVIGAVVGIIGLVMGTADVAIGMAGMVVGVPAGLLVWLIWGVVVVRMALRKRYRNFRITLLPAESAQATNAVV